MTLVKMESRFLPSNKFACASSTAADAASITDDKPRDHTGPLPWSNQARCQSEGGRKRSHQHAFDPVLTVTSTNVSFSSTSLKDTPDSSVMVSSDTFLDKRPYRTTGYEEYVHICSDDEENNNPIVPKDIRDGLSNNIGIQGSFVSNIKEKYCIVASKTNTDVRMPLYEPVKHISDSECASQSIIRQEDDNSQTWDDSQVEHNLNEMEVIGGSSHATVDVHLDSAPSSNKKQRKRKHTHLELKVQLVLANQVPLHMSNTGANVTKSPYPCGEFIEDINPPSDSNDYANQRGSREFNAEKFFASRVDPNIEKNNPDNTKNAENYLYEIRQPSALRKPSLDRYSRDQVSPLAEGYILQDGVYKIPLLTDGSNVEKSYHWEESLSKSSISKKSKTIPLVQQQNIGCLTSPNVQGQLTMSSAPCSVSSSVKNIEKQKSTTEITCEIRGLHLNDRALQASSSSSSPSSSSLSIVNDDSWCNGSPKLSKKTKSLKSAKKTYKLNQQIKSTLHSNESERLMDIENLAQRIENMSTSGSLDQLTASASFNQNKDDYENTTLALSKPKDTMTETPKKLSMNPTVVLERLTAVTSDIPVKLSHIYGLDRDGDPSNYSVPLQSKKQSEADVGLVNLNNSSSEKININFNAEDAAAEKTNETETKKAAVTEDLLFREDKDTVVSRIKTTCLDTSSDVKLKTQSALLLENISTQGGGEQGASQLEKLDPKSVCQSNVVTTAAEKDFMPGNVNTQKTSDFPGFINKQIFTAVIVKKEDTNSEETAGKGQIVCTCNSTELTVETKTQKSDISTSTVHALAGLGKNKQSHFKITHPVPQLIKRKDKTASVPVPLTPEIYRYLVENAGVVVKPLIPPASRTSTNQGIGTFKINHKSNASNPVDGKCSIPMITTTESQSTKSANIPRGNIVIKPSSVCVNTDDHSYTIPSVCGTSNISTTLKYPPLVTQNIPLLETNCHNKVQQKQNLYASTDTTKEIITSTLLKQEQDEPIDLTCHSKSSLLLSEVEKTSSTGHVLNNTVVKQEQKIKRMTQLYLGNNEAKVVNIQPESVISKVQSFFSSVRVQVEPYALKCGERMFLITMPAKPSNQRTSVGLANEQVTIPQMMLPETVSNRLKSVTDEYTQPKRKQDKKNSDKNGTRKNIHAFKVPQKMTVVLPKYPGKMDKFVNALVLRSVEPTAISDDKTLRKKSSMSQYSILEGVKHLFTLENLNVSERKHASAMMTVSGKDESHCRSSPSVVKIVQIFKESDAECRFYMHYISIKLTPGPSQGYHRWFQYSDYPCRIYFHFKERDEITHIDIESSRPGFYLIPGARNVDFRSKTSSINAILSPYPPCLHNLPDGSVAIAIGKLLPSKDLPEGVAEKKIKCLTTSRGIINVLQMILDKESFKDLFSFVDSRYKTNLSKDLSPKVAASKFYGPELFNHFTPRHLCTANKSRKVRQQAEEANKNDNAHLHHYADLLKVVVRTPSISYALKQARNNCDHEVSAGKFVAKRSRTKNKKQMTSTDCASPGLESADGTDMVEMSIQCDGQEASSITMMN